MLRILFFAGLQRVIVVTVGASVERIHGVWTSASVSTTSWCWRLRRRQRHWYRWHGGRQWSGLSIIVNCWIRNWSYAATQPILLVGADVFRKKIMGETNTQCVQSVPVAGAVSLMLRHFNPFLLRRLFSSKAWWNATSLQIGSIVVHLCLCMSTWDSVDVYSISSLRELFDTVKAQYIFGFTRDIGLYRLL